MKNINRSTIAALTLGLLTIGSALAADQYYMRVPAPAACSAAACTIQPSVRPGSQAPGGQPGGQQPGNGSPGSGTGGQTPPPQTGTPVLSVAATSLEFGTMQRGYSSPVQSVRVSNTGTASLAVSGISIIDGQADFGQSNNCGSTLSVGAFCDVAVTFSPSSRGALTGTLALASNGGTAAVNLSGWGLGAQGTLTALTTPDYGAAAVGVVSMRTFRYTNTGDYAGYGYLRAGNLYRFTGPNTCGTEAGPISIPVGGTCQTNVQYLRPVAGDLNQPIEYVSADFGVLATISPTGSAFDAPIVSTSATSLSFAATMKGTSTTAQTVQVTNTGTAPLTITGISLTAGQENFGQSNNCGSSLVAGASCEVAVSFTPATRGTLQGSLAIVTNDRTAVVSLTGTGNELSGTLTPATWDYGINSQNTATLKEFTFTNTGTVPVTTWVDGIDGTILSTNSRALTCGTQAAPRVIQPGSTCRAPVYYRRATIGTMNQEVSIQSQEAGKLASTQLTGVTEGPQAFIDNNVASLTFNDTAVNAVSPVQTVVLRNHSAVNPLSVSSVTANSTYATYGTFQQTNDCGTQLAPGAHCNISITYAPKTGYQNTGGLTIVTSEKSFNISLQGKGAIIGTPSVTALAFGDIPTRSTAVKEFTFRNESLSYSTVVSSVVVSNNPEEFVQTNDCGNLAPGASCTIRVAFTPIYDFGSAGTVTIYTEAGGVKNVSLSGVGSHPLVYSASEVRFAPTKLGATSVQSLNISNPTDYAIPMQNLINITNGTSVFTQSNTCGASLAPKATCTVTIVYKPTYVTDGTAVTGSIHVSATYTNRYIHLYGPSYN